MNVGRLLSQTARQHRDRPAITFAGRTSTYGDLNARVDALAAGLGELGVSTGDRVVVWMHNHPAFLETMLACWKRGLVVVPVNARLTPGDVAFHAQDSGAAVLVHGSDFTAAAPQVDVRHRIGLGAGAETSYEDVVARGRGAGDQTREVSPDAPAWLFYTSGTTGRPKGATLTHATLGFVVVSWCADLHQVQPEDVVLHCAPLSHGAGFHALVAVARGASAVVHERFDPAAVLDAIDAHGVTTTWLVPTQIRMLLDADTGRAELSSLTHVVYGGSPIARADLVSAIGRLGPVLCQLYGQGEVPMTIASLRREAHRLDGPDGGVLASAGVVRTGMEIRIRDADGGPLPDGEIGEITVRGPAVMAGYWARPEATAETLRDGWLHTGDLGRFDERGNLHLLDRAKDLIITGGANVYAREVEDVILTHPDVEEAAVFGVPDRIWGEAVTAVVVADRPVTEAVLLAYCRPRIAGFKRPKRIHLVEALPRNAYGKVVKRALRDQFGLPEQARVQAGE